MNHFEKRINALRLQFLAERKQIQKDSNRTIGHLNTAIGQVSTPEARDALRAEKARVYEATRESMRYNRLCYRQQLEAIEDERRLHAERHPSRRQLRRIFAALAQSASDEGKSSLDFALPDGRRATIAFS